MKPVDSIVRVYIREASHLLNKIIDYLKSEEIKISRMTVVFRVLMVLVSHEALL